MATKTLPSWGAKCGQIDYITPTIWGLGRKSKWVHKPCRFGVSKVGRKQTDYITPAFWAPRWGEISVATKGGRNHHSNCNCSCVREDMWQQRGAGGGGGELHNAKIYQKTPHTGQKQIPTKPPQKTYQKKPQTFPKNPPRGFLVRFGVGFFGKLFYAVGHFSAKKRGFLVCTDRQLPGMVACPSRQQPPSISKTVFSHTTTSATRFGKRQNAHPRFNAQPLGGLLE